MVRIAGVVAILLPVFALTNIVYQVIHKPTEPFFFVGHGLAVPQHATTKPTLAPALVVRHGVRP